MSGKNNIEGIPSKELFITMLIKDLSLSDAIVDLIDNSVDAANLNSKRKNDLSKFKIEIILNENQFIISDNCGGIEEEVARKSAFRFGKPKKFTPSKHTIGQFGIGMKRAFFKIGQNIVVESVSLSSSFKITIPVKNWKDRKDEKDWDFQFDSVNKKENNSIEDTFTKISITGLKDDVKKQFTNPQFLTDLSKNISKYHLFALNKGLNITLNSIKLKPTKISLMCNDNFRPSYWSYVFPNGLKTEIIVGIAEDDGDDGGWYLFCNDRLILGPEQTEVTGWKGGRGRNARELPKYHDQYFRFRGYTFFNSDDPSKLPWNTSKTGFDKDSNEFSKVRSQMILMGKQVKEFLDLMKKEREKGNPVENQTLNNTVNNTPSKELLSINNVLLKKDELDNVFEFSKQLYTPYRPKRNNINISFKKPRKEVKDAISYFDVENANDAGSLAWDYFIENTM